jgi:serine/threonine protein phosphatase PrpC
VTDILKKLFGKKEKVSTLPQAGIDVQTAPLSDEQLKTVSLVPLRFKPPQLVVGTAQSVGMQRDHNEDTLLTFTSLIADGNADTPFGLFVMADGMGGHQSGEVASGAAARALAETVLSKAYWPFIGLREQTGESIQEIMEQGVMAAQQAVLKKAPGGGTTLTAALVMGEQVTLAHVGDSRAYFIHPDGRMHVITQDHSLVHRLVELGQITEEEAMVHPQKNVLYRAVGQTDPYKPDILTQLMPHPGYLLLCCDGLWGVVPEAEIFKIVKNAPNASLACNQLVQAANDNGGPDNISVILVNYLI